MKLYWKRWSKIRDKVKIEDDCLFFCLFMYFYFSTFLVWQFLSHKAQTWTEYEQSFPWVKYNTLDSTYFCFVFLSFGSRSIRFFLYVHVIPYFLISCFIRIEQFYQDGLNKKILQKAIRKISLCALFSMLKHNNKI